MLGAAKTGSGKTLAFLIPAVNLISKLNFKANNSVGVLVITPTRELAIQILDQLNMLTKDSGIQVGSVMGGMDRKAETQMLKKGINILVATPGRLLDHLKVALLSTLLILVNTKFEVMKFSYLFIFSNFHSIIYL